MPQKHFQKGISIIEAMVAMVVISIGLLGMAGLMSNLMVVQTSRKNFEDAITLTKAHINAFSKIPYGALGTGTTVSQKRRLGAPGFEVTSLQELNVFGETSSSSVEGPFIFFLHHLICHDPGHPSYAITYTPGPAVIDDPDLPCDLIDSNKKPSTLYCGTPVINQVKIKVLTAFRDKDGRCRQFGLERTVINLE